MAAFGSVHVHVAPSVFLCAVADALMTAFPCFLEATICGIFIGLGCPHKEVGSIRRRAFSHLLRACAKGILPTSIYVNNRVPRPRRHPGPRGFSALQTSFTDTRNLRQYWKSRRRCEGT